jgi:hypothetical protein
MYYPEHFSIWELVPPDMQVLIHDRGSAWAFNTLFDERLLRTMDMLRDQFGSMQANTWKEGGRHCFRGFRPPYCDIGAELSQHRFGRAVDLVPLNSCVDHIRKEILKYPNSPRYHHIGGLELDVNWLHIDVRGRRYSDKLRAFRP